eukprot:GEMP01029991.1.p1 GENE.GEMP01029991.1~~GEMP01029991.1.p1  ORF type:complete len:189 (+),score=25.26 GEMP01029991.1:177-743(+)
MIKIFGVGRGKPASSDGGSGGAPVPGDGTANKRQPGEIRMQKEMDELELAPQVRIFFPQKDNIMQFQIQISPDESYWKGASFVFSVAIPPLYPHEPPKVKCETKVYHPNIDLQGSVCLNILREDWKPVLSISSVVYGLLHLFLEPNPNDPLNHEAAEVLRQSRADFNRIVARTLRGCSINGEYFQRLI